jgi:hypothetical protein
MEFSVEKYVSNFVQNQFPRFYQEEGSDFVLFLKAYYEWMEESGNPIREARSLFDYRDIDNTIEDFLEYFQKKYLYGIPFNIIANKRFLLKHILDVYRSKGTIQCYRLLFKLLYNLDIEVYLPGRDVLRVSDGIWVEPKYIEVSGENISQYVGNTIRGISSGTTAVVENYIKESFNASFVNLVYISNILPKGGEFEIGEKIIFEDLQNTPENILNAPVISGSLDNLEVINGGQNFLVGDILKIANKDPLTGEYISSGAEGTLRVLSLSRGFGSLAFNIINKGFGYLANAETFIYRNDSTGSSASFDIGSLSSTQSIEYNTDLICDYANLTLNALQFNFPANNSANLSSNIGIVFSFTNDIFGSLLSLTNIRTGNGYTSPANVFVRSTTLSYPLTGAISYDTTSNTVTGVGTIFTSIFSNNDTIALKANNILSSSFELQIIKEVVSNTQLILYGPPSLNSTATAEYRAAPTILPSNFAIYEPVMENTDGSLNGENEIISAIPNASNSSVSLTKAVNSGKGYLEGEIIKAYLFGSVSNNISIISGGSNYTNNDTVIFAGGDPGVPATGYVVTNGNGSISNVVLTFAGSGYNEPPNVRVKSETGFGALIEAELNDIDTSIEVTGKIVKSGIGKGKGYWNTTRGLLNSDKYIQDSYYYQDYSYEIKVAETLERYKSIIYDTFHNSGSELFGKYLLINNERSETGILFEVNTFIVIQQFVSADSNLIRADSNNITTDAVSYGL